MAASTHPTPEVTVLTALFSPHLTRDPAGARRRRAARAGGLLAVVALAVTGCGADEETASGAGRAPTTTAAESTTTTEAAPHEGDIDVALVDFGFEGLPGRVAAGPHTVNVANEGTETHEMFLFRNRDGLSLEEIHALGPAGAPQAVDLMGIAIVEPGESSSFDVDLPPGEYEAVCFVPTPTDGRAHYEHGMHAVIQVE